MENEDNKQRYLEFFDKVFGTNTQKYIDLKEVPLLSVIYENMKDEIWAVSKKYKRLRKEKIKKYDELSKDWTQEQIDLFEEYWDLGDQMEVEMNQQAFFFGVIIAKEFATESRRGI